MTLDNGYGDWNVPFATYAQAPPSTDLAESAQTDAQITPSRRKQTLDTTPSRQVTTRRSRRLPQGCGSEIEAVGGGNPGAA